MFAREIDDGRKAFVELVGTKNIQTRVVGGVLSAIRMDVNSMGSVGPLIGNCPNTFRPPSRSLANTSLSSSTALPLTALIFLPS